MSAAGNRGSEVGVPPTAGETNRPGGYFDVMMKSGNTGKRPPRTPPPPGDSAARRKISFRSIPVDIIIHAALGFHLRKRSGR